MQTIPLFGKCFLRVDFNTAPALTYLSMKQAPYKNLNPALRTAAQVMRRSFARQFAVGGEPAWTPLSPFTIAKKRSQGVPRRTAKGRIPWRLKQNGQFGPENILIARGMLRDSYVQSGAIGHIERYTEDSVFVGSNLKTPDGKYSLAAIHQYGATINRQRLGRAQRKSSFGKKQSASIVKQPRRGIVIPARPLHASDADRTNIKDLFRRWFSGSSSQ